MPKTRHKPKKPGRKPTNARAFNTAVMVRMYKTEANAIRAYAKLEGRTLSNYIRHAIECYQQDATGGAA